MTSETRKKAIERLTFCLYFDWWQDADDIKNLDISVSSSKDYPDWSRWVARAERLFVAHGLVAIDPPLVEAVREANTHLAETGPGCYCSRDPCIRCSLKCELSRARSALADAVLEQLNEVDVE